MGRGADNRDELSFGSFVRKADLDAICSEGALHRFRQFLLYWKGGA